MRLFFSFYCFQKAIGNALMFIMKPLLKVLMKFLETIPWMQNRHKKQGRIQEQAEKDGLSAAYNSIYEWNIVFASINTEVIFTIVVVILFMLPQLLISTPYFVWCMDNYTIYSILAFFVMGYIVGQQLVFQNDKYISYFQEYVNDSNYKRWCWHFTSILIVFFIIVIFILLTFYCRKLGDSE